jgi:3-deoxy-manno-octulosonate cytidylyltransferase (CMP-KDO synthetase)
MTTIALIPARYAATRLPGKVLADIAGKPMVQHVYERACRARTVQRVLVATDDERIRRAVEAFGGEAIMTSPHHLSGTDRLAEAVQHLECEIVVNVQGDEPLIEPEAIDAAVQPLLEDPTLPMSTLKVEITDPQDIQDPSVVKVVTDRHGLALYFSRYPIPYPRDAAPGRWYQHIGLYAYRRDFLLQYARWEATPLQLTEQLEQLKVLENGYRIKVVPTSHRTIGVDTPEDLERVRRLMAA